jgi:uncharacterized protein (TIGR02452 family)
MGLSKPDGSQDAVELRRHAWLDTWKRIKAFAAPMEFCDSAPVLTRSATPRVRAISNEDCIDAACRLAGVYGNCGILNMSSARRAGGGVWRGARAQEEELCRRSNLYVALMCSRDQYPLHGKVLVHKDVVFFKKGAPDYARVKRENQRKLTVFTSPAVKATWPCNHLEEMRRRINTLVAEVEKTGVVAMVFGAWGCGSFGLNPQVVANLFKERLLQSSVPIVHFGIVDDHNGSGNYDAFRKILCSV